MAEPLRSSTVRPLIEARTADKLEKKVYFLTTNINNKIARLKLEAMGVKIDTLSAEQVKYLGSWEEGT